MLIKNGFFMFKIEAPSRCKDLTVFDKPPPPRLKLFRAVFRGRLSVLLRFVSIPWMSHIEVPGPSLFVSVALLTRPCAGFQWTSRRLFFVNNKHLFTPFDNFLPIPGHERLIIPLAKSCGRARSP